MCVCVCVCVCTVRFVNAPAVAIKGGRRRRDGAGVGGFPIENFGPGAASPLKIRRRFNKTKERTRERERERATSASHKASLCPVRFRSLWKRSWIVFLSRFSTKKSKKKRNKIHFREWTFICSSFFSTLNERASACIPFFFPFFFLEIEKKLDSISKWKQRQGPGQTVLLSFLFEQLGNNSVLYWKWLAAIRRLFIHRRREPRRSFFFLFFFDYFSLMKGPKLVHSVARSHYYGKKKKKEKPLLTRPSSRGNPSKNLNETQ